VAAAEAHGCANHHVSVRHRAPRNYRGAIYFVVAFRHAASVVASMIGGVLVAAIAMVMRFLFRAAYTRRGGWRRR
jgi:hypothetical protein